MTLYEYKVVPAPAKGEKQRGVKTPEARFAAALERAMNELAAEGWEYHRAETLPSEERSGLTSSHAVWRNVLVFRRPRETAAPVALEPPMSTPAPDPRPEPALTAPAPAPVQTTSQDDGDENAPTLDPAPSRLLADRAARLRGGSEEN